MHQDKYRCSLDDLLLNAHMSHHFGMVLNHIYLQQGYYSFYQYTLDYTGRYSH
jgi:hypothetical protein